MRIGSLFSGAGGLDMAVEAVFGGHTVWHSEIDKAASKVLAHRFPGVPNLGSITEIDWARVEPVDVLCGGFPCTDVSAAGKRAGMHGTRSGLWSEFAKAIEILRPRMVVIENVRGILSAHANRPMESDDVSVGDGGTVAVLRAAGAVLGDLADLGYDAVWATVAAADVGAPHRRERVFIVGTAAHAGHDAGCAKQGVEHEKQARWVRESGHRVSGDEPGLALLPTPRTRDGKGGTPSRAGDNKHDLPSALLPTPRSSDCFGAGQHGDGGMDLRTTVTLFRTPSAWGKYEPAIRRWEQIVGPAPAPTEPNKNNNPRLSAAFSEWLMGWPAGWVTDPAIGISRNDQLRIIGNGVVSLQCEYALRYLLSVAEVSR